MYKTIFKTIATAIVSMVAEYMVTIMTIIITGWVLLGANYSVMTNVILMSIAACVATSFVIVTTIMYIRDNFIEKIEFTVEEKP